MNFSEKGFRCWILPKNWFDVECNLKIALDSNFSEKIVSNEFNSKKDSNVDFFSKLISMLNLIQKLFQYWIPFRNRFDWIRLNYRIDANSTQKCIYWINWIKNKLDLEFHLKTDSISNFLGNVDLMSSVARNLAQKWKHNFQFNSKMHLTVFWSNWITLLEIVIEILFTHFQNIIYHLNSYLIFNRNCIFSKKKNLNTMLGNFWIKICWNKTKINVHLIYIFSFNNNKTIQACPNLN